MEKVIYSEDMSRTRTLGVGRNNTECTYNLSMEYMKDSRIKFAVLLVLRPPAN